MDETLKPAPPAWKLKGFYYAVQISGILVPVLTAVAILYWQEYFIFLIQPVLAAQGILIICVLHAIFFILRERTKLKLFYTISRWAWVGFWAFVIYITGAATTGFLFLLVFPVLVSVVDLDAQTTKRVGIVLIVYLLSLIVLDPRVLESREVLTQLLFRAALFSIIVYYLYKIVNETLRQKYEKEETKRKFSELIELDRVKSDFITVVSHQLRTPLSALRWAMSNLIEEDTLSAAVRPIVLESQTYTDKALDIVNELIVTSESQTPSFVLKKEAVPVRPFFKDILSALGYLLKEKQVSVDMSPLPEVTLSADRGTFKAALTNILDNAVRYSPKGTVLVSGEIKGDRFALRISDTGIGIPPEDFPYITDRFYRAKNAISLAPNETGVGLYIAKKIIEKHGGSLLIDSALGKGTAVTVTLPL